MLQARDTSEPAFVLDEGGSLVEGQVPGVVGPVAAIGIAEKGYVSLELSVSRQQPLPSMLMRIPCALSCPVNSAW